MKYMGSKAKISTEILQIILKDRAPEQWYVEPFAGGMNMICEVRGNRIANDVHYYLIEMWKELVKGWIPQNISKEEYEDFRCNKEKYSPYLVGWVGFNCSYSGRWFRGFAGETKTKIGTIRDYQAEAIRNVIRQVAKMDNVFFENKPYDELRIPPNSIIYCDPPYNNTAGYANDFKHGSLDKFDHKLFWQWVRDKSNQGHTVFVSEYSAPDDFEIIWEKEVSSSLSANGVSGGSKLSTERLFIFKGVSDVDKYRSKDYL